MTAALGMLQYVGVGVGGVGGGGVLFFFGLRSDVGRAIVSFQVICAAVVSAGSPTAGELVFLDPTAETPPSDGYCLPRWFTLA